MRRIRNEEKGASLLASSPTSLRSYSKVVFSRYPRRRRCVPFCGFRNPSEIYRCFHEENKKEGKEIIIMPSPEDTELIREHYTILEKESGRRLKEGLLKKIKIYLESTNNVRLFKSWISNALNMYISHSILFKSDIRQVLDNPSDDRVWQILFDKLAYYTVPWKKMVFIYKKDIDMFYRDKKCRGKHFLGKSDRHFIFYDAKEEEIQDMTNLDDII